MLRLFANIRKSLLAENKTVKYLKYAVGEVLLIMVGIILALQFNNWNEGRKNRVAEIEILTNLQNDFIANQESLSRRIDRLSEDLEALNKLRLLLHENSAIPEASEFNRLIRWLRFGTVYVPADGVINSITAPANLSLISNKELKHLVGRWPEVFGNYSRNSDLKIDFQKNRIIPYLNAHYPFNNYHNFPFSDENYYRLGQSRHKADIEYLMSDLAFENIVANAAFYTRYNIVVLGRLRDYQTELLEMLDEELAP